MKKYKWQKTFRLGTGIDAFIFVIVPFFCGGLVATENHLATMIGTGLLGIILMAYIAFDE